MDYSYGKISTLTTFLYASNPPPSAISRFLALDTFAAFEPNALMIGLLESDGSMLISGSFGMDKESENKILPMDDGVDSPLLQSIKNDEIMEIEESEALSSVLSTETELENSARSIRYSIIWPIYYIGAGVMHFEKKFTLTPLDKLFFRAIGGMLALNHTCVTLLSDAGSQKEAGSPQLESNQDEFKSSESSKAGVRNLNAVSDSQLKLGKLTSRQFVILAELARGKTNSSIADDLNFSESLIRQETIEIYRKMGISGRRELLKNASSE